MVDWLTWKLGDVLVAVLWIRDTLVRNWIRISGSIQLTSGSCSFHQWPSRCQQKISEFFYFLILIFEGTLLVHLPHSTGSVFGNWKSCWSDRTRFPNSDNFEEDYDEGMMMISAEREQRDHQAVEKPLPVREETFIQVTLVFYYASLFRAIKQGGCLYGHASGTYRNRYFSPN